MLSHEGALRLHGELGQRRVLSVYLNGEETDPAERRAWRVRLRHGLEGARAAVPPGEAAEFEAAVRLVEQELAGVDGLLPERGWVAFASGERLWYAGPSPAPMPDLVRWQAGMHLTPYLRALKQSRPVTLVLADQRHARVFRYLHGALEPRETLRADDALPDSASAGASKRAANRSGMRGEPRGDATQRALEAATQRMLREAAALLAAGADEDRLLMVGGSPETVSGLRRALPERARERAVELTDLRADATPAEVKAAIDAAASALSARLQKALVDQVIEATRAAGRGCLGWEPTERALRAGAVETLLVSRRLARAEPDLVEHLVDRALEQGAVVEEVGGPAAGTLDREGGIGARLRFAA